jgi:predicted RNA-binding protein with PUA-like domain
MKSEPDEFSIDDLARVRGQTTCWFGVRNYQARNFMRDGMRPGDLAFLYHSSCAEPAVTGVMEICRAAHPDPTQFDRRSPYYDPGSKRDDPRWLMVDVRFRRRLRRPVTLAALRATRGLAGLALLQRGNRLSVMPVSDREWDLILGLE